MRISLSPAATLFHADCRDAIKSLPSDTLDSCCTDPPYALVSITKRLGASSMDSQTDSHAKRAREGSEAYGRLARGFMGKTWDTGETAFSTEFWQEVFRVLKPGAFVAAFGASRGYHRMACAIEDAGFEIRDSLAWIYGSGFPKSHSVDKGIDAHFGAKRERVMVPSKAGNSIRRGEGEQGVAYGDGHGGFTDISKPVTPQAAEWEGWGTALKPAFEPIVLARKPLSEGTVAANVLRWRTGALNIGASRIPGTESTKRTSNAGTNGDGWGMGASAHVNGSDLGRWPANVVTDGSDEVVAAFPNTGGGGTPREKSPNKGSAWAIGAERSSVPGGATYCDQGSAARFFYSAKASKADRHGSKHPTVKPISLMEWLATLITPPGGTVLDPFAGSGTTGIAATRRGFRVVLCEREAEYVGDIKRRFNQGAAPVSLDAVRADIEAARAIAALQARLLLSQKVRA